MGPVYDANIDSGYAWVVVLASFALHFQQVAPISTLGIFLVEFAEYFSVSKTSLGWIGACQLSTGYLLGVVIGPLARRVGYRLVVCVGSLLMSAGYLISFFSSDVQSLYVTFGLLTGVGIGCLFTPATIVVQLYFYRKRAFAASIAISGTAVGVFFWPPFARWMIDIFSWRGGLVIMSAMQLHGLVFGALLRPRPEFSQISELQQRDEKIAMEALPRLTHNNIGTSEDFRTKKCKYVSSLRSFSSHRKSQSETTSASNDLTYSSEEFTTVHSMEIHDTHEERNSTLCKYAPWVLFFFGNWLIQSCHVLITVLTPVRAHWLGIENQLAALLISIYGVSSGVSRSVMGWIGDRQCVNRLVLFGTSAIIAGACTCVSASLTEFWMLAVYSFVFGILAASYIGLLGAVVVSVFTLKNVAIGTGVMSMTVGFANLITHPLAGWLVDQTGGYTIVFIVFGVTQITGGLCILSIGALFKFKPQRF